MSTGARRESWSEKKNDDELLATTFQLLMVLKWGAFDQEAFGSYHKSKHNKMFHH